MSLQANRASSRTFAGLPFRAAIRDLGFEIGRAHFGRRNLRFWFQALYETLLGSPRPSHPRQVDDRLAERHAPNPPARPAGLAIRNCGPSEAFTQHCWPLGKARLCRLADHTR